VVEGFDADIRPGEFFSLLGPSGSGKTTTLMMIAGFTSPDAGQIVIDGHDLTAVPPQRRGLGMVFQNYALFPHLSVFENVAFPLRARSVSTAELRRRVLESLALVRLADLAERRPRQLSGGQQQRVAIARAIVFQPGVVLMDEPLGALDKNLRYAMQTEVKDIQQRLGMTVIYVTHDQEEALNLSDRVAIMNRGRVEQIGPPRAVYEHPANSFVGQFLGEANLLAGTVLSLGQGVATFRTEGGLDLRAPAQPGVVAGARAFAFMRPEKLALGDATGTNRASGQVRRVAFLGGVLRCVVALEGGGALTLDLPNDGRVQPPQVGETVKLGWNAADTLVLPE